MGGAQATSGKKIREQIEIIYCENDLLNKKGKRDIEGGKGGGIGGWHLGGSREKDVEKWKSIIYPIVGSCGTSVTMILPSNKKKAEVVRQFACGDGLIVGNVEGVSVFTWKKSG